MTAGASNPPAIVLGGQAIAIPVVRSLATAGVKAHAVGADPAAYDCVAFSRHVASYTDLGSGDGVVDRWMGWLAEEAPKGAVLLPCSDEALELVVRHREQLEELGHVPIEADPVVLAAMLDKERTYKLAREVGVPVPRTWVASADQRSGPDPEQVAGISFPCAVKPLHSHLFTQRFGVANKLLVADDRHQLREGLARMERLGLEMAVTEIIPGPDTDLLSYCGYLGDRGEPLTHFTFRKLRQFPIHFGLGCYVVSDWNEEVIEAGLRFLRGIGLRGLFHLEFKRDHRDGKLKLLECNHRFVIEATFAPIDLPLLAYNRVLGRPPPQARRYRSGTHLWSPVNDVRALLAYRRRGELTAIGWLRSLLHRQRFQTFAWSDPLPALRFHIAWLARAVTGRLGRRPLERPTEPLLAPHR